MTKTLYLVRHAKSDWKTGQADFDRPLNKRGRRDAPDMGLRLKQRGALPALLVCSPARRANETCELLDLGTETDFNETIYEASAGELLDLVQQLDDRVESAMLIGHNPAMTWLAGLLSGERIEGMPTCAVAAIEIETARWRAAGACPARLLWRDYPRKAE
ncbi:histidine phosphatase family protein [Pontiella sp.]|uniref:SixA phosphatase family protein n=1 Tax=Pontiella sp. TaxID=2837462 RepID=UPI00356A23C3